ncbi:MAG: RNA polymerase sigma factor [Owenweeksia sp.]
MKDTSEIIQGCLKNDRRSQFQLYDYCFNPMMSICIRYERDEEMALEILNLAFIKVLKKLDTYEPKFPFDPWFKRITVNEAIDSYRRKARRMELFDNGVEDLENHGPEDGSGMEWVEREYLEHILKKLKKIEQIVFNLYAVDGYSHKEIAEELDMSERSSIRHLASARRKLQDMLPKDEIGLRKA